MIVEKTLESGRQLRLEYIPPYGSPTEFDSSATDNFRVGFDGVTGGSTDSLYYCALRFDVTGVDLSLLTFCNLRLSLDTKASLFGGGGTKKDGFIIHAFVENTSLPMTLAQYDTQSGSVSYSGSVSDAAMAPVDPAEEFDIDLDIATTSASATYLTILFFPGEEGGAYTGIIFDSVKLILSDENIVVPSDGGRRPKRNRFGSRTPLI